MKKIVLPLLLTACGTSLEVPNPFSPAASSSSQNCFDLSGRYEGLCQQAESQQAFALQVQQNGCGSFRLNDKQDFALNAMDRWLDLSLHRTQASWASPRGDLLLQDQWWQDSQAFRQDIRFQYSSRSLSLEQRSVATGALLMSCQATLSSSESLSAVSDQGLVRPTH